MIIDFNILEHLGLKMYTSLPAVISEYVANSWDAGAKKVWITVPDRPVDDTYAVSIQDNGIGMKAEEVQQKFLVVGRARREEEGTDEITVDGVPRKIMGRKGIGKLAGFGVAGAVALRTVRNGQFVEFVMDYDKMKDATAEARRLAEEAGGKGGLEWAKATYKPNVTGWGETGESDGTNVELRLLKRTRPPSEEQIRRHLARRFSVIGENFEVILNDKAIIPADRDLRAQLEFAWDVDEAVDSEGMWRVVGWVGTLPDTVPEDIERGVVIMARGKLVQAPTTFDVGGKGFYGMHALAYLVGELHAEFVDDIEDLISTSRNSIVWESPPGMALRFWANEKIKSICKAWVDRRTEKKMASVRELPVYKERIAKLPRTERGAIERILEKLSMKEDVTPDTIERVADYLASGVEYSGFLDLVTVIMEAGVESPKKVLEFVREWEVLDAIEMQRIVEGRLYAILRFQDLIESGAREWPDVHSFLIDNPWLLDPTWNYIDDEVSYRRLLLRKFVEPKEPPEENRRIDFLCLGHGQTLNVIELKRPGSSLSRADMRQLEDYVDFIRSRLGTGERAYQDVVGYIIGGQAAQTAETRELMQRLAQSRMYVRTFMELQSTAIKIHKKFLEVLERKAGRIDDPRMREGLERMRKTYEHAEAEIRRLKPSREKRRKESKRRK